MGRTVVNVGRTFLGSPYKAKTLEINEKEQLVINLQAFDCTTYVENVLAFSLLIIRQEYNFSSFGYVLQNIRYRDGLLDGYTSRLHYFTDWLANNEAKGLIRNISREIGGIPLRKRIDFMSSHRELYPMLKAESDLESIKKREEFLSGNTGYFLPRDQVLASEDQIREGDIIALTTSIEGLDVTHTGFAVKGADGRIHLLHASTSGEVEISEKPLAEYLGAIKKNTGIIVARPL